MGAKAKRFRLSNSMSNGVITVAKPQKTGRKSAQSAAAPYTTTISKAGALLSDTKIVLAHWDLSASSQDNLDRFQSENIFGKESRGRVEDILRIFRLRYLGDEQVTRTLVRLVDQGMPAESLDRILYFHATLSDSLLHDVVTEFIYPLQQRGRYAIHIDELQSTLSKWVKQGKTKTQWSDDTIGRCARGLLSTLRDFGVLQGAVKKTIAPMYLSMPAFAYVAFYLKGQYQSGKQLLDDERWRLFFMSHEAVERFFLEAHQRSLLEYHAAGHVIRVDFPAPSLEEYAHVIAKGST